MTGTPSTAGAAGAAAGSVATGTAAGSAATGAGAASAGAAAGVPSTCMRRLSDPSTGGGKTADPVSAVSASAGGAVVASGTACSSDTPGPASLAPGETSMPCSDASSPIVASVVVPSAFSNERRRDLRRVPSVPEGSSTGGSSISSTSVMFWPSGMVPLRAASAAGSITVSSAGACSAGAASAVAGGEMPSSDCMRRSDTSAALHDKRPMATRMTADREAVMLDA
mmetsp:Transcript_21946/g.53828  ORF Transcript_21946/g.53828 Transcript_21946/m.53828 type:complete len:225 (+) Transcript_21946:667-1341(+)